MFGSVDEWFFEALAGIKIDPEHPGFKHFLLGPQIPEKLTHAQARHHCMYGEIRSAWRKKAEGTTFRFTVPFNTSATITLPVDKGKEILEGDAPLSKQQNIEIISRKAEKVVLKVGSGRYDFLVN
ncbi:MAG: alpha-L-rhamnosidase C-terminal domain-containing protein, partial [Bacteroidota bacterium]